MPEAPGADEPIAEEPTAEADATGAGVAPADEAPAAAPADDAAEGASRPRSRKRPAPTSSDPPGRRRDHRRHRSREERGAARVRAPRRRDSVERRDRPRAAAARRGQARRSSSGWATASSAPDGELDRGAIATVVFNDPRRARLARGAAASARVGRVPPLARAARRRCRDAPRVCVTEVPLLYEAGGDARFDKVVVITAPDEAAARALRRGRPRSASSGCSPDREKVARADYAYVNTARSRSSTRSSRWVMDELAGVRRLLLGVPVLVAVARRGVPLRLRDEAAVVRADALSAPLRASRPRAGARERPRPGAGRRGDLPGVEVPPERRSASGAVGLMQLTPGDGAGDRAAHRRHARSSTATSTTPTINIRYGAWYLQNLFDEVRQRAARARRLQRGPGERRPLARERRSRSSSPRRARTSKRVEHLKRVYREAWRDGAATQSG